MPITFDKPHLAARLYGPPLAVGAVRIEELVKVLGPRLIGSLAGPSAMPDVPAPGRDDELGDQTDEGAPRNVAVIPIRGTLVNRAGGVESMSGLTSYASVRASLRAALDDPAVEGIVLDVDSPGGECAGLPELAQEILAARAQKPVVAIANTSALSAAYWLSAGASRVLASPSSSVGSIGVLAVHVDQSQADRAEGVAYTFVHAGEGKADGNPHQPLSDRARADVQARVDRTYGAFVDHVARARGLEPSAVMKAKAAVLSADEALEAGLVDEVGTFDQALSALADLVSTRTGEVGGTAMKLDKSSPEVQALLSEQAAKHKAELEAERQDKAAMKATLETLQASDKARRAREVAAYVGELQQRATIAQSPLKPDQVAAVQRAFERGCDEDARLMGEAFVRAAVATGTPASALLAGRTIDLGAGAPDPKAEGEKVDAIASQILAGARPHLPTKKK